MSAQRTGDEGVLGLAGPVARHHAPAGLLAHAHRLDALRHRADLVHLQPRRTIVDTGPADRGGVVNL